MEASKKEPNVLQMYEELKTEFENHAYRVDDVLLYPVLDTKNERTLYTLLQLKERFSHLKYLEGKTEHKFVQEWADDPNKKAFRKMDVIPKDCPPDVYNLWEGYDREEENCVRGNGGYPTFSRFALGYERRRGKRSRVSFEVDCFSISKSREETEDSVGIPVEGRKWEERVLGVHW